MRFLELMGFGGNAPEKSRGRRRSGRVSQAVNRMLKAFSYEASEPGGVNESHWSAAGSISARQANSRAVRETLRNRSRYETANNPIASGIVDTYVADLIGDGARLQVIVSKDSDYTRADAQELERVWNEYADAIDLWGKVTTLVGCKVKDGEIFANMGTNEKNAHPVKLDLQIIEADRVTDERSSDLDILEVDGIHFDEKGNPTKYRVLKHHPDDRAIAGLNPETEADFLDASQVIHYFTRKRAGQVRGIPDLTPSLEQMAQLRRWNISTLTAAENAADNSSTIETNNPIDPEDDSIEAPMPFDEIPMSPGMATVLPDGYTRKNLKPEFPTVGHGEFVRSMVSQIARPLSMPVNVALADSSEHNYASGKLDSGGYYHKLGVDRRDLRIMTLDRYFREFVSEATLNEGLIPEPFRRDDVNIRFAWMWPVRQHADPSKEAAALEKRLDKGITNEIIECANLGLDWQEVLEGKAEVEKFKREIGLSPATPPPANANSSTSQEDQDEEDQDE